jgi:hypothetical protein
MSKRTTAMGDWAIGLDLSDRTTDACESPRLFRRLDQLSPTSVAGLISFLFL